MNNERVLVTIAIPTYNRADAFLKEALESALAQSYEHIEIIVADNCSTDGTKDLVARYDDKRIRYMRHECNIGANSNFNFCVARAFGHYFLLLHDDDRIDSDFVETCLESVQYRKNVGLIRTGVRIIDEKGHELRSRPNSVCAHTVKEFVEQWMDERRTSIYLCSVLYNTQVLREIGGFSSAKNHLEDNVAELVITNKMGRHDVYPVKASFRRHGDNAGGAVSIRDWAIDSNHVIGLMKEYIPDERLVAKARFNLSEWNYNRAYRLKSRWSRWHSFFVNYKAFGYQYSPFNYLYRRDVKPKLRRLFL